MQVVAYARLRRHGWEGVSVHASSRRCVALSVVITAKECEPYMHKLSTPHTCEGKHLVLAVVDCDDVLNLTVLRKRLLLELQRRVLRGERQC